MGQWISTSGQVRLLKYTENYEASWPYKYFETSDWEHSETFTPLPILPPEVAELRVIETDSNR